MSARFHGLLGSFRALGDRWCRFWLTPGDPTTLGLCRIGTGMILCYILALTTPWLLDFYGPDGWYDQETATIIRTQAPIIAPYSDWRDSGPADIQRPELDRLPSAVAYRRLWDRDPGQTVDMGVAGFSVMNHLTDPTELYVAHGLCLLVAVLFTLGVATRITSVLALVAAAGYIHRTPVSLFGQDCMLMILLIYLAIGPSGAALSVDSLIRRYRRSRAALALRLELPDLAQAASVSATVALRLLQVHFCIIYFLSATSKLQGAAWWNGSAIWQTLANFEFAPPSYAFYEPMLRFLAERRWLWEIVMFSGAVFTIVLELTLPFLIWNPKLRGIYIVGVLMLHGGIGLIMGLNAFSTLMICIVLAFIPGVVVSRFMARLFAGSSRFWMMYNSRRPGDVRAAAVAHAFDVWGQVALVDVARSERDDSDLPGWLHVAPQLARPQLATEKEETLSGYPIFERLARSLRLLWPLGLVTLIPGIGALGRWWNPGQETTRKRSEYSLVGH